MQHASQRIAKRYAKALFELKEPSHFDAASQALNAIADAYEGHHELQVLLDNPSVPSRVRKEVVIDLISRIAPHDAQMHTFFALIFENGRIGVSRAIAHEFNKLVDEFRRSLSFEAVTSTALSPDEQHSILATLQQKLGREVTVEWKVNPTLLGGMQLRMGDRLLDGSVEGQLRKLYSAMLTEHAI